jgi:hypothetical protein
MRTIQQHGIQSPRRGFALVYATVVATAIAGLCVALLAINMGASKERVAAQGRQRSFYAAEAGLSDAYMQFDAGLMVPPEEGQTVFLGTPATPVKFGRASYWVTLERLNARQYRLTSSGQDGILRDRLQLVIGEEPSGFFQWSAFGASGVRLDSNSFIDSYDSSQGTYESQVQGGNAFARENGHVGSNQDIVLGSNSEVHGDARPGPNGYLDDTAPGTYISGSTEPVEEEFEMVPIDIPPIPSSGSIAATSDVVVGPGDVHYDSIALEGGSTLVVRGPAQLVVDNLLAKANSTIVFDATNGPIEVYGTANFQLLSNSEVQTVSNTALDVTLLLSGDNQQGSPPDKVDLSSNAEFVGAVYAPNAMFSLGSNFNIYGSIICDRLDLSSNGKIHFDEALLYDGWGASGEYAPSLWRRQPAE